MDRRQAIGALVAAATLPVMGQKTWAADQAGNHVLPPPILGPRMNFVQADKVMAELGLEALILGQGVNLRHATGLRPVVTRMGFPPSTFAVVTRAPAMRVALVSRTFTYYYNMADVHEKLSYPAFLYDEIISDEPSDPEAALALSRLTNRGEVALDAIELARIATTEHVIEESGSYSSLSHALAAAMKRGGIEKGRVAIDHPRIAGALEQAGVAVSTVDADDALRRIRPVKSKTEIELMRYSSAANIAAVHEALAIVRNGGSYRELRAEFFAVAARRGQRGVFMVIDRSSDEQFDAEFREGQAFLIDCVSEYEGYHGDYGRTVFVGEPSAGMIKATRAMADGWSQVREQLKPGVPFSAIEALGQKALKQEGRNYRIPFRPHSVGLYHTDHFGFSGLPPVANMTLEPGMIISVDCPLLETGVGGSAHLEDLMLITADGSEPLHDIGNQTITL